MGLGHGRTPHPNISQKKIVAEGAENCGEKRP